MIPIINLYLDSRRAKTSGKYPIKLRVYSNNQAKQYRTGLDATEEEFFNAYQSQKPRKEFRDLKIKLQTLVSNATNVAEEIEPFVFEKFEKQMYGGKKESRNVYAYYERYIAQLTKDERVSTASSYTLSQKSLKEFKSTLSKAQNDFLAFDEITPDFLAKYENWMHKTGRGSTTIGIYLRPLRALFNLGLQEGDITQDVYPFGKRKYQIPAGRKVKKALSKEDLKALYTCELPNESFQGKARDFWFFSYQCNGMNIKDILGLQYKDIQGDIIVFTRAKTKNSTKTDSKQIIVPVTDYVKQVIKQYGNKKENKETYVFPIFTEGISELEKHRRTQNFTKFINQHIKKLAETVGITTDISTYWARHSFTTNAIRNGASMEFIQDSLGHKDMKTTMNYWGGFEESVKRDISEKIMNFA